MVICEWGETYCCIAGYDAKAKQLRDIKYFTFDKYLEDASMDAILQAVKEQATEDAKVVFCSAFPEALLIPKKQHSAGQNLLDTLFTGVSVCQTDHIGEWGLVNAYAFPTAIQAGITKRFSDSIFYHAYTPSLKVYNGFDAAHQVMVHFAPSLMRVIVKKTGNLQLAQTYRYTAPLDAVYYLLKIVEECALDKEVLIILSGLIEEDSALYKELYQFFANISFAKPIEFSVKADQPTHYFTSLHNLAACVS